MIMHFLPALYPTSCWGIPSREGQYCQCQPRDWETLQLYAASQPFCIILGKTLASQLSCKTGVAASSFPLACRERKQVTKREMFVLGNQIQFLESSDWTVLQNDGVILVLYQPCHRWIWFEVPIYPNHWLCSANKFCSEPEREWFMFPNRLLMTAVFGTVTQLLWRLILLP